MTDFIPMVFGRAAIFHPERSGDQFPMDLDLFDEVGGEGDDATAWACPFIGDSQIPLSKIIEALYGPPAPRGYNPFNTATPAGFVGEHQGPTRNTVNGIVTEIKSDAAMWKQFNALPEATARIRRGLCVVAKLPENFLSDVPIREGATSSSSTQGGSNRFSQHSVSVRAVLHDNTLLRLSGFTEAQVNEINHTAINALNKSQSQLYTVGGNFTRVVHPRSIQELRLMVQATTTLVSKKLSDATIQEDHRSLWIEFLSMVNSIVTDTEDMLRLFKSHTCASVLHANSKTGASLLAKGTMGPFAHALHKWSLQQSSLGNLRVGPLHMQFVASPVNFIHLLHLFHFVFEETSGPAVQKAKSLLLHYSEVITSGKKRGNETMPNSPNKRPKGGKDKKCYNCQKTGHLSNNCPDKESRTCFKCGEKGHIASKCTKKSSDSA